MADTKLPHDIEQFLIHGQRLHATHTLMQRRDMTLNAARAEIARWLFEHNMTGSEGLLHPGSSTDREGGK